MPPQSPAEQPRLEESSRDVPADAPGTGPAGRPRRPIPFRRPGEQTVVIYAHGFAHQRAVLTFAAEMEAAEAFSEVSLTRVTADEAWFAVRAASADHVRVTLRDFEGFDFRISVDQNLVTVDAAPEPRSASDAVPSAGPTPATVPAQEAAPAPPAQGAYPGALNEGEPLLPPRPRFRVFRPVGADASQPAARPPAAPPVVPPATQPSPTASAAPGEPPSAPPAPPAAPEAGTLPRDQAVGEPPLPRPESEASAEQLTLVVYPFHSFAALNDFQSAVRRLRGVTATRVRRFYRGTLHLAVDYEGGSPLSTRINDLTGFRFDIASASRSEIEVVLTDDGSLTTAAQH